MKRKFFVACALLLILAGCGRESSVSYPSVRAGGVSGLVAADVAVAPASAPEIASKQAPQAAARQIAYAHDLSLEMAPENVSKRFDRARQECLQNAALKCILVRASIQAGEPNAGVLPSAVLEVRLPHDTIETFQQNLLKALPDEKDGDVSVRSRSTNAEDLTEQVMDVDQHLAQATDFRTRLTELAKHTDAKLADLIQVEEKLAETQSEIERITAERRGLSLRVDTENLTINLNSFAGIASVQSPLGQAWHDAGRVLGENTASAFTFIVSALPWIPVIIAGFFLLRWFWRFTATARQRWRELRERKA